jgi:hypothetical protein
MVNQIELILSQLPQRPNAGELEKALLEIEDELIQRKLTGQGQDTVRWPPKLLSKIGYLASGLASGDFAPTKQQREVHALFKQQLTVLRQRLNKLLADNNIKSTQ